MNKNQKYIELSEKQLKLMRECMFHLGRALYTFDALDYEAANEDEITDEEAIKFMKEADFFERDFEEIVNDDGRKMTLPAVVSTMFSKKMDAFAIVFNAIATAVELLKHENDKSLTEKGVIYGINSKTK